ncbi:MAG: hypothetical protein HYV47_00305 [Candidatus Nealsonbacteria bacterium]|nr:hypothetical protein [Candidatus Nealsonbacteria bacterium]
MGGGGTYYDRDVTDRNRRTDKGFSDVAESKMSRSKVDAAVLPRGRKLTCTAKSPVVYAFDVTGSMGDLPKIIFDKMPMMAGQLIEKGYLEDVMMSLSAVGDILSDQAPLQVCDFALVKNLDEWLQRIWLEGQGGGQARESYEFIAYFYAKMCDIPNAETPIFLFTGDEGFRENLPAATLREYFGKGSENTDAKSIFEELKKKFKGNVFLIHRRYNQGDQEIVAQWENVLGKERVIKLGSDLAIADVTLGVFAIVAGKRTLEEYLQDMKTRGQDDQRIAEVRKSLEVLAAMIKPARKISKKAPATEKKKPGRI